MSLREASRLVWYFDSISPYSYLQFAAFPELMQTAEMRRIAALPVGAARRL